MNGLTDLASANPSHDPNPQPQYLKTTLRNFTPWKPFNPTPPFFDKMRGNQHLLIRVASPQCLYEIQSSIKPETSTQCNLRYIICFQLGILKVVVVTVERLVK